MKSKELTQRQLKHLKEMESFGFPKFRGNSLEDYYDYLHKYEDSYERQLYKQSHMTPMSWRAMLNSL